MDFLYDALGNRVSKSVHGNGTPGNQGEITYYVRDAQGNVLSTYTRPYIGFGLFSVTQDECHIYGSDRLGLMRRNKTMFSIPGTGTGTGGTGPGTGLPPIGSSHGPLIQPGDLRITQLLYDSPLYDPSVSGPEVHVMEMLMIQNLSGEPLSLESVKIGSTPIFLAFLPTDILAPDQEMLILNGTPATVDTPW